MFYMKPVNGTHTLCSISKTILRAMVLSALIFAAFTGALSTAASPSCLSSNGSWANQFLSATETGSFRVVYDATPSATKMDAVSGFSYGFANEYTDLAAAVRLNLNGSIDARNGSTFSAANFIPYTKGVTYHFIFDVNVAAHSYNIYVVVGSTQKTVGSNFKFRTEQSADKYLNSVGALSATGSLSLCNMVLSISSSTSSSSSSLLLNASSTSLNFGNVGISSGGSDQYVTLTNAGTANITISKVAVAGTGFTAGGSSAGITLSPNQTTTIRATFDPSATGKFSGTVTVSSNATNSPASIALFGTAVAGTVHAVTLTWQPGSTGTVGYNVYAGSTSGGPYSRLNTSTVTNTSYVNSGVQSGQTYYFVVTSVSSSDKESARSTEVKAAVP
jgi:hypothetical protein